MGLGRKLSKDIGLFLTSEEAKVLKKDIAMLGLSAAAFAAMIAQAQSAQAYHDNNHTSGSGHSDHTSHSDGATHTDAHGNHDDHADHADSTPTHSSKPAPYDNALRRGGHSSAMQPHANHADN